MSPDWLNNESLGAIHSGMQELARRMRLPFRSRIWSGQSGNWQGAGLGSSIDFQDHRPYLPGDDLRYIDWQAYARTGHYSMKLYREEVSPTVDLILDISKSMFFDPAKGRRTLELFYFCVESALQSGASLRCHSVDGSGSRMLPLECVMGHREIFPSVEQDSLNPGAAPALERIQCRQSSMRIFVSDLLYAGSPETLLRTLSVSKGRGLIFAPFLAAEATPDWDGNIDLEDCESSQRRVQFVSPAILAHYHDNYLRHFEIWKANCRKHAAHLVRVSGSGTLREALQAEALPIGAVEML
jgi:uncharacterized protein (DUF58 family)